MEWGFADGVVFATKVWQFNYFDVPAPVMHGDLRSDGLIVSHRLLLGREVRLNADGVYSDTIMELGGSRR